MKKQKNIISGTVSLWKYQITILLILNIVGLGVTIIKASMTGRYVDLLTKDLNVKTLSDFVLALFVLEGFGIFFLIINGYYTSKIQTKMTFDINYNVLEHIKSLPLSYFKDKDAFYINQRVNSDTNMVTNFLLTICVNTVTILITFVSIIIILYSHSPVIAFVAGISIPIFLLLYFIFNKLLIKRTKELKESQNRLFSFIGKQLDNITYIKTNALYEKLGGKLLEVFPAFFKVVLKYLKISMIFASTSSILGRLFNVFLYIYVGIEIMNRRMTVGEFVTIQSFYATFLNSITEFTSVIKQLPEAKVSYDRLLEILGTKKEVDGDIKLVNITNIKTKSLTVQLGANNVLTDFSYDFKKGIIYLIRGANGAGKSTLLKSILGLYNENIKGDILINQKNISDINMYYARRNLIAVVDQECEFFFDSIGENLNYKSAELGALHTHSKGFKLTLKESNIYNNVQNQLSGGERQKVAIIRALLKEPDVLIMDEPSSSLDEESVDYLIKVILNDRDKRITIIVSHDMRFPNFADEIIDF